MKTFKKKDIEKLDIDELIDSDGSIIDGDDSDETTSQIQTAPQQTTDKFATTAKQRYQYPYGYLGTPYSHGDRGMGESVQKMEEMVEEILTQKLKNKDIVNKNKINDINKNKIPDLEELGKKFHKQDIAFNIEKLTNIINKSNLNGEEKAIIINYIINNIDTQDIDNNYKRIIKSLI